VNQSTDFYILSQFIFRIDTVDAEKKPEKTPTLRLQNQIQLRLTMTPDTTLEKKMMWVCVFKEPTWSVDSEEVGSFIGSTSLAAVLPNSRHPVALWDGALGSLDFLENRLLEERQKERLSISAHTEPQWYEVFKSKTCGMGEIKYLM